MIKVIIIFFNLFFSFIIKIMAGSNRLPKNYVHKWFAFKIDVEKLLTPT